MTKDIPGKTNVKLKAGDYLVVGTVSGYYTSYALTSVAVQASASEQRRRSCKSKENALRGVARGGEARRTHQSCCAPKRGALLPDALPDFSSFFLRDSLNYLDDSEMSIIMNIYKARERDTHQRFYQHLTFVER